MGMQKAEDGELLKAASADRGRGAKQWLWLGCDPRVAPDLVQDGYRKAGTVAVDIQAHHSSLLQSAALVQLHQPLSGVKHSYLGAQGDAVCK